MTKKFWDDWKKRIGETNYIALYRSIIVNGEIYNRWNLLNHIYADDRIVKATFNGDSVDLVIEKFSWVIGHGANSGQCIVNKEVIRF